MSLLTEEQIKKLQEAGVRYPHVNESCIGCSACVAISGDVFDLDDEGKSVVQECENYEDKMVDDAISACPVDAISWKG
ncbi:MAG: ferredoxin [Candidatus Peribacteria bacterium]|nr:MAG: ferredoxin [Candidatus Peribacteria bacterium]